MAENPSEIIALQALDWVMGHDDLRPVFLGSSGISPQTLARRAGDSDLLLAVLDFLATDDAWVLEFCASAGLKGEDFLRLRAGLPGGTQVHWT